MSKRRLFSFWPAEKKEQYVQSSSDRSPFKTNSGKTAHILTNIEEKEDYNFGGHPIFRQTHFAHEARKATTPWEFAIFFGGLRHEVGFLFAGAVKQISFSVIAESLAKGATKWARFPQNGATAFLLASLSEIQATKKENPRKRHRPTC